ASDPRAFAVLVARKLAVFWSGAALGFTGYDLPLGLGARRRRVDVVVPQWRVAVAWALLMLLAAAAGLVAAWRRPALHPWLLLPLSQLLVTAAFFGYARQ